jgi:hypothetical protein
MHVAGGFEGIFVATEGLQEALIRALQRAEEPPLVEDHGPRADGEEHQGEEHDLGDETQRR